MRSRTEARYKIFTDVSWCLSVISEIRNHFTDYLSLVPGSKEGNSDNHQKGWVASNSLTPVEIEQSVKKFRNLNLRFLKVQVMTNWLWLLHSFWKPLLALGITILFEWITFCASILIADTEETGERNGTFLVKTFRDRMITELFELKDFMVKDEAFINHCIWRATHFTSTGYRGGSLNTYLAYAKTCDGQPMGRSVCCPSTDWAAPLERHRNKEGFPGLSENRAKDLDPGWVLQRGSSNFSSTTAPEMKQNGPQKAGVSTNVKLYPFMPLTAINKKTT